MGLAIAAVVIVLVFGAPVVMWASRSDRVYDAYQRGAAALRRHRTAWSRACGGVAALFGTGALAAWIASADEGIQFWVGWAFIFGGLSFAGVIGWVMAAFNVGPFREPPPLPPPLPSRSEQLRQVVEAIARPGMQPDGIPPSERAPED